jgi:hypothetical protein
MSQGTTVLHSYTHNNIVKGHSTSTWIPASFWDWWYQQEETKVSLSCLDTWEILCDYWLAEGTTVIPKKHHIIIPSCVQNQNWPLVNTTTKDTVSFNLSHKNQNNVMRRFKATNTTNLCFYLAEVLFCALGPHQNIPAYKLCLISRTYGLIVMLDVFL